MSRSGTRNICGPSSTVAIFALSLWGYVLLERQPSPSRERRVSSARPPHAAIAARTFSRTSCGLMAWMATSPSASVGVPYCLTNNLTCVLNTGLSDNPASAEESCVCERISPSYSTMLRSSCGSNPCAPSPRDHPGLVLQFFAASQKLSGGAERGLVAKMPKSASIAPRGRVLSMDTMRRFPGPRGPAPPTCAQRPPTKPRFAWSRSRSARHCCTPACTRSASFADQLSPDERVSGLSHTSASEASACASEAAAS
mmetsp:Transcript_6385/g.21168  ORF Transcript_6385/g.21168 Transcript_6385/m.21168 type:complete len:255 (+) Transcript_6385:138-902(+)